MVGSQCVSFLFSALILLSWCQEGRPARIKPLIPNDNKRRKKTGKRLAEIHLKNGLQSGDGRLGIEPASYKS